MEQMVGPRTLHLRPKPGDYLHPCLTFVLVELTKPFSCAISYEGNHGRSPVPHDRPPVLAQDNLSFSVLFLSVTRF